LGEGGPGKGGEVDNRLPPKDFLRQFKRGGEGGKDGKSTEKTYLMALLNYNDYGRQRDKRRVVLIDEGSCHLGSPSTVLLKVLMPIMLRGKRGLDGSEKKGDFKNGGGGEL